MQKIITVLVAALASGMAVWYWLRTRALKANLAGARVAEPDDDNDFHEPMDGYDVADEWPCLLDQLGQERPNPNRILTPL